jgi:two-component system cell cycle sensor histidine kinase/response regulator CckA
VESEVQKLSVLLVDDEDMVLTLGRVILERRGYEVCVARSGTEAIAICQGRTEPLDCAIIDFTMPDMNGRETLAAIRKIFMDLPALISSGYSDEEIVTAMDGLEFNGTIHKPYRQEALLAALQQALTAS